MIFLLGKIPKNAEMSRNFKILSLPSHLLGHSMALNRLEAHLLKIVLPFIRVMHIPRSADVKVCHLLRIVAYSILFLM